jgi:hypothetical protein
MFVIFFGGAMNVDAMLRVRNEEEVDYLLIGGMNFLICHPLIRGQMTSDQISQLKREEERKRNAAYNPAQRWQ